MNKKIYALITVLAVWVTSVSSSFATPRNASSAAENVTEGTNSTNAEVYADKDLPTELGNGSFENTVIEDTYFGKNVYGSKFGGDATYATGGGKWCLEKAENFENWEKWETPEDKRFYWQTTAYDEYIELGVDDSVYPDRGWSYVTNISKGSFKASEGTQFAELIAEEKSSLYQNIATTPGRILSWGLSHRSRGSKHPKDIMALFIGPMQEYSYKKSNSEGNDIFIWMAKVIEDAGYFENDSTGTGTGTGTDNKWEHECSDAFTIYSKPGIDIKDITENNYNEYFSLTKTTSITEEWNCWIISDTYEAWGDHVGTYEVPEGQERTTFAFTALNGYKNNQSYYNEGNLLDSIKFAYAFPLRVATTGGGTGTVSADDTDVFGNRVENVKVESGKSYTGDYLSGTNVTITAKAEDENVFLGAYVNDKFCSAADESYFSEENGTYTLSLTLTAAEYVQLIFSKKATVTYDPNGGMYNGTEQNTEITMAAIADSNGYAEWKNLSDAEPINKDRVKFIGWYFARAKEDGALIKSDHTVTYDANNTVDDTSDDKLKVEYTEYSSSDACVSSVSADTGLTFVAQWEYLQEVVAMTKKTGEATYKKSNVGGTVSMEIQKSVDYRSTVDFSDSSQGYARLNDTVVLTAKVADSATNADTDKYVFMGWYDEDGNVLSRSNTYTYSVTDYKTVYAHFSASIVYPYLSFVSEKQEPDTDVEMFKKSHVRVGDEYVWQNDLFNGGNGLYGNTIATGFTLQTKGESGKSFDRCMWTITIPSGGTYIKIPENSDKDAYSFYVGESPVLTDEDVKVNKGSIYEVTGVKEEGAQLSLIDGFFDVAVDEDEEEGAVLFDVTQAEETPTFDESNTAVYADEITGVIKVRMLDKLPTVLTGGSVIMYGIVIDNLYSPGASAVFELTTSDTAAEGDMIDITADNNSIIHADSSEEYQNSAGNGYSSVKK